jgi:hypothetical protein
VPALAGLNVVSTTSATAPPGQNVLVTQTANCPAGQRAVSGGYASVGADPILAQTGADQPVGNPPTGWSVTARVNPGAALQVFAVCANVAP